VGIKQRFIDFRKSLKKIGGAVDSGIEMKVKFFLSRL